MMKSLFVVITFLIVAYCFGKLTEEERKLSYNALYKGSVGAYAGDMKLNARQKAAMRSRAAINNFAMRWTNNYMPYAIDASLMAYQDVIQQSAQHIEDATGGCIQVRPWNGEANYVNLVYEKGCNADIGMQGGRQDISLGENCQKFGIIVHEFMHAIGFDHEQNRPDRDDYITVHWGQIETGMNFSFFKQPDWWTWTPFDFDSIMIYGNNAFSRDGTTWTMSANDDPNRVILHPYDRTAMSPSDIYEIKQFYNCT